MCSAFLVVGTVRVISLYLDSYVLCYVAKYFASLETVLCMTLTCTRYIIIMQESAAVNYGEQAYYVIKAPTPACAITVSFC